MRLAHYIFVVLAVAFIGCGQIVERRRSSAGANVVLSEICSDKVYSEFPLLEPVTPVDYGREPMDLWAHEYYVRYESSKAYADVTNSMFRHMKECQFKTIDADESRKTFQFQLGEKKWRVGFRDVFSSNTIVSATYYY